LKAVFGEMRIKIGALGNTPLKLNVAFLKRTAVKKVCVRISELHRSYSKCMLQASDKAWFDRKTTVKLRLLIIIAV